MEVTVLMSHLLANAVHTHALLYRVRVDAGKRLYRELEVGDRVWRPRDLAGGPQRICQRRSGLAGLRLRGRKRRLELNNKTRSAMTWLTTSEILVLLVVHPHEHLATRVQRVILTFPISRGVAKDGQDVGRAECERRGRLVEDRIKVDGVVFPAWAGEAI